MQNQYTSGFTHTFMQGVPIDRSQTSQIDELSIPIIMVGQNLQCPVHPHSIGDQGELASALEQPRFSDGCVESVWCHIATNCAVKRLVFKKEHWIRVVQCGIQKPLGVFWKSRIDHLQTRRMGEPSLVALAVERTRRHTRTRRHADDHIGPLSPAVMDLRKIVAYLGHPFGNEIGKLHLHHGLHALHGEPEPCADNGRFAKRCIAYPLGSVTLLQTFGGLEHTPVGPDVLAHENKFRMRLHGLIQCLRDGIQQAHLPFASFGRLGDGF